MTVGSDQGGNIPETADDATSTDEQPWVIDPQTGEPGVSCADFAQMSAIADELSGTALRLDSTNTMGNGLSEEASGAWRVTQTVKQRTRIVPVVWPMAIAVAVLLAWELGSWMAQSRRLL